MIRKEGSRLWRVKHLTAGRVALSRLTCDTLEHWQTDWVRAMTAGRYLEAVY